jgi:hypothetical protein
MKKLMMKGCSVKKHHKNLEKIFKQKKITKEKVGGFIFPLIGNIIKAVRSNNAHKERVKQHHYNMSEEGRKKKLQELRDEGRRTMEEKNAYEQGLQGKGIKKMLKKRKMIN